MAGRLGGREEGGLALGGGQKREQFALTVDRAWLVLVRAGKVERDLPTLQVPRARRVSQVTILGEEAADRATLDRPRDSTPTL